MFLGMFFIIIYVKYEVSISVPRNKTQNLSRHSLSSSTLDLKQPPVSFLLL